MFMVNPLWLLSLALLLPLCPSLSPHHLLPRIYLPPPLSSSVLILTPSHTAYLSVVLRAPPLIRVFNAREGEYLAATIITKAGRKSKVTNLTLQTQLRPPPPPSTRSLQVFATPLPTATTSTLLSMVVQLGCTGFTQVETERTNAKAGHVMRLRRIAGEAVEQCERIDGVEVGEMVGLGAVLEEFKGDGMGVLFVLRERREELMSLRNEVESVMGGSEEDSRVAVLVGPPGGWSSAESQLLDEAVSERIRPVSMGENVLRTETACVAAVAVVKSVWDDRKGVIEGGKDS